MLTAATMCKNEFATLEFKEGEHDGATRLEPFLTLTDVGVLKVLEAWRIYRADELWDGRHLMMQSPEVQARIYGTENYLRELALKGKDGINLWKMQSEVAEGEIDLRVIEWAGLQTLFDEAVAD
jgi:hypothetical protein